MELIKLRPDVTLPELGTEGAAAYDIFMPTAGDSTSFPLYGLGFKMKVPAGFCALILPRSSAGAKHGINLRNTMGVIDSDYEGEWMVAIGHREGRCVSWAAGERLFQFVIVPATRFDIEVVEEFSVKSARGEGGFGHTGK